MEENDLVSVLLPVYNSELYIGDAIESLLNQTYRNIEVIIIDDCSSDDTFGIISKYSDERIRYYKNDKNMGIVYSLNRAMDLANGSFLARMDADDICMPNRLEEQLKYMKDNPDLLFVSCWFETFGNSHITIKYPKAHKKILTYCLFGNPMLHPGYFMDREKINRYKLRYDESMKYVEDFDFAIRGMELGSVANVPKVLMKYRTHNSQTNVIKREQQKKLSIIALGRLLNNINVNLSDEDVEFFKDICHEEYTGSKCEDLYIGFKICSDVIRKNNKINFFDKSFLNRTLCQKIQIINIRFLKRGIIGKWQALKISAQLSALSCSARPIMNWIKAYLGDLLVNI